MAYKISAEESTDRFMKIPLHMILCFSLDSFRIFILNFCQFNYNINEWKNSVYRLE